MTLGWFDYHEPFGVPLSAALSPGLTSCFLLCFSVDSPESLENIPGKWKAEMKHFSPKVPIILVANKTDLRNDPATIEGEL